MENDIWFLPTGYTPYEPRRYLGGATHFASFHEALAEQSARISLVQAQTRLRLIMILRSNQLS